MLSFCFSRANVDDRDTKIMSIMTKEMSGKLFGYKGYQKLAEYLWNDGVELIYIIGNNLLKVFLFPNHTVIKIS